MEVNRLEKLKKLLSISDEDKSKDAILEFILSRVTNRVKNHCNLKSIPKGLEDTVIQMCLDLYQITNLGHTQSGGEVKSISKGDTSTSFKPPTEIISERIKTPHFINEYKSELNTFRKMRW